MSERVVAVPLPDGRWLALSREAFAEALAAGAELLAAQARSPDAMSAEPLLVDAAQMAKLTSTAPSWWEAAARDLDCPSVFVGRVRRFKVSDCLAWLETVQERDTNGHARRCGAAPRARA
ncbi:MAG: hypothetical protein WCB10_12095 [Steroidobacteraceae bacterium]